MRQQVQLGQYLGCYINVIGSRPRLHGIVAATSDMGCEISRTKTAGRIGALIHLGSNTGAAKPKTSVQCGEYSGQNLNGFETGFGCGIFAITLAPI